MVKNPFPSTFHSGGCQCGAFRYRIHGSLGSASICHCRMCQKAFGNFAASLVDVPATAITWTRGSPAVFRSSSIVSRGFCRDCGTPMYMREDGDQNYEMAIGTLDDPNVIAPMTAQTGIESKVKWFDALASLPHRTTPEDRSPDDLAKLKSLQQPDHDTEYWP